MGKKVKNWFACVLSIGALIFGSNVCKASENVIYVINNNSPNYSMSYGGGYGYGYGYGGNVMCTDGGGICATGRYMMSTSRVRYVPPQWKRPTIRERRLTEGKESVPYAYRQAYYR